MGWEAALRSAEELIDSPQIPQLDQILSLIKRVNPTSLGLGESDRERGYRIKNGLQNLLLENYGEYFHLVPLPWNPEIILIKHQMLPTIDACHARLEDISVKALDSVAELVVKPPEKLRKGKERVPASSSGSAKETVKRAEQLLDAYEYGEAEELLAGIRIKKTEELPVLLRAARLLTDDMGAYQRAIELLLGQPRQATNDRQLREFLALAYYHNDMKAEARAVLETLPPGDLDKATLCAWAHIAHEDGNFAHAWRLLQLCDEKDGAASEPAGLRKNVELALAREVEPELESALAAFRRAEIDEAARLARGILASFPGCRGARELIAEIEWGAAREQTSLLWQQFEKTSAPQARLELLGRLLERDRNNREKIKGLMEREKTNQQQELVEERLGRLREQAARQAWPECFPVLRALLEQEDRPECLKQIEDIAPCFSVLFHNRKLQRLPEHQAQEVWLAYLAAVGLHDLGSPEGNLETMERVKPYFGNYPDFKDAYRKMLAREQEAARGKAEEILARLGADGCPRTEAERLAEALRKVAALLPCEERTHRLALLESHLQRFKIPRSQEYLLEELRSALFTGCAAKARSLRGTIEDRAALERLEAEVAETFRMQAEPVTVTVCPDLPLDLSRRPNRLTFAGSTSREVLLMDGDDSLILVDLKRMQATRYRSRHFKGLFLVDRRFPEGDFLFWKHEEKNVFWRARLEEHAGAFTAVLDTQKTCGVAEEDRREVYLSGTSPVEYVLSVAGREGVRPPRLVKFNVDKGSVVHRHEVAGSTELQSLRLSAEPERFVVNTMRDVRVVNKNLRTVAGNPSEIQFLAVDEENARIYAMFAARLQVLDACLNSVGSHPKAITGNYFLESDVIGICLETRNALMGLGDERALLYNLDTNLISNIFNPASILCTSTPSTWYHYDYRPESNELLIRKVTGELESLFEWQELFSETDDEHTMADKVMQLEDETFFAYQPPGPPKN